MSEKKTWGSTVLGWFVVREPEHGEGAAAPSGQDDDAAALIAKYAGGDAPPSTEAAPPAAQSPVKLQGEVALPSAPGAAIDFPAVYRGAGIDDEEQSRVQKAAGLLSTLPKETPKEVKRQIVEASLKAFGYPVEQIIEAGAGEIQALQAYIELGQAETQKLLADSNARIAELEKEIALVKQVMEEKIQTQYELTNACNEQKLAVQGVLEFFGQEAVARVVRESPKLVEPKAQG